MKLKIPPSLQSKMSDVGKKSSQSKSQKSSQLRVEEGTMDMQSTLVTSTIKKYP